jgi:transposase, IS4 family
MRGSQDFQGTMFSDISLEERVPAAHPLRKLRGVVDALLATMDREFEAVYARRGRPSVPSEMLLKVPPARRRRTHESTTDADARPFKNRRATPSEPPQASKSGDAACLIGSFSTAC